MRHVPRPYRTAAQNGLLHHVVGRRQSLIDAQAGANFTRTIYLIYYLLYYIYYYIKLYCCAGPVILISIK